MTVTSKSQALKASESLLAEFDRHLAQGDAWRWIRCLTLEEEDRFLDAHYDREVQRAREAAGLPA